MSLVLNQGVVSPLTTTRGICKEQGRGINFLFPRLYCTDTQGGGSLATGYCLEQPNSLFYEEPRKFSLRFRSELYILLCQRSTSPSREKNALDHWST